MTLNILNRTVKNKNAWLKTKYLLMQLKFIKKKSWIYIFYIHDESKIRLFVKMFFKHIETNKWFCFKDY